MTLERGHSFINWRVASIPFKTDIAASMMAIMQAARKKMSGFILLADIIEQMDVTDMALVREFAAGGSDEAFAELVRRHVNLVYSVALRRLGNSHDAEEVTQVVFIILAKKAFSLGPNTVLSGWLYQTAQLTAANFQRSAMRRHHREQEAFMQISEQSETGVSWHHLSPMLEEAMMRLGKKERDVIVLRFFENRTVREVAAALGLEHAAAQKRVNRATEKLREYFSKRGVQVSTTALLASIGTHAVQAAPPGFVSKLATTATLKAAVTKGSTLALIKTTLKIMAWTKAKTTIVVGAGILLAAGTSTMAVRKIHASRTITAESWRTPNLNANMLDQMPPQVRILPTKFPGNFGHEVRLGGSGANRKVAGINVTVPELVSAAYYGGGTPVTDGAPSRTIFTGPPLPGRYDFVCTLGGKSSVALQQELKRELGLVSHREKRDMDVLLLKIARPGASGLKANPNIAASNGNETANGLSFTAVRLSELAGVIENFLGVPIIDQTGTTEAYDVTVKFNRDNRDPAALKQALLDQLGLELVPSRQPIEVLVVDHAN